MCNKSPAAFSSLNYLAVCCTTLYVFFICRELKQSQKTNSVCVGAERPVRSCRWPRMLPGCPAVPRDPQPALTATALRPLRGPCLTAGLNAGFWGLIGMGKTWPCLLANELLETPSLFFSFPLSQVFAGSADGDVCSTCKDGDVLTSYHPCVPQAAKNLFSVNHIFPQQRGSSV